MSFMHLSTGRSLLIFEYWKFSSRHDKIYSRVKDRKFTSLFSLVNPPLKLLYFIFTLSLFPYSLNVGSPFNFIPAFAVEERARKTIKSWRRGEAILVKFRRISASVVSRTSAKYGLHFGMHKLRGGTDEVSHFYGRARAKSSHVNCFRNYGAPRCSGWLCSCLKSAPADLARNTRPRFEWRIVESRARIKR